MEETVIQLIEIDPNKKYVILTQDFVRSGSTALILEDFEKFLKDPNQHLFIISRNLILRKAPENQLKGVTLFKNVTLL